MTGLKPKYAVVAAGLLAVSACCLSACAHATGGLNQSIRHDGLERSYLIYTPALKPAHSGRRPLLLALHGGGGTHRGMIRLTKSRFNRLADRDGFFVVYPQGVDKSWNDGRTGDISGAHRRGVDDIGFFRRLIEDLVSRYPIDPQRVFATGISNGGLMSLRLGCSLPEKIRAIAPVTASLPSDILPICRAESTVGLAVFNGTADPLVPYAGGQITVLGRKRGEVLSTDETIRIWRRKNRCGPQARETQLPDIAADDTRVTQIEYDQCESGSSVALYRIDGGGHTWPDGQQYLPVSLVGKTTRDINGCDEIWKFFQNLK